MSTGDELSVIMMLDKLPPFSIGGAEVQAMRLARRLSEKGVKVAFLTPGRDKIKGTGDIDGIPVYRLHSLLNYPWDWASSFKKKIPVQTKVKIEYDDSREVTNEVIAPVGFAVRWRYVIFLINCIFFFFTRKGRSYKILHVHSMEWPSFIGARLASWFGKQLVIKDATMNGIFGLKRFPKGKAKLKNVVTYGHFVAMSRVIRSNFLKAGVPESRITSIPNGIEIGHEKFKTHYPGRVRKVIFVGNLGQQPAKGIDLLLKAWVSIHAKTPDAQLQIVGEGPTTAYEEYSRSLGLGESVFFLGKRTDITTLLFEADLFVLPSRREGMPNALMEAMLTGLPCIATNISGSQDLIENGTDGILVPPANIAELSSAIWSLMDDAATAERMGRSARRKIIQYFDLRLVAGQYVDLYEKLLGKR